MASNPARGTVSASTLGIARRTKPAKRNRSSKSSCTIKQSAVLRVRSIGWSWVVAACVFILILLGSSKYDPQHGAHGHRAAVLQCGLIAQMTDGFGRRRVEYLRRR